MTVKSPEGPSVSLAVKGGQLVAHGPLQADLALPATSLSNVYSVMPLEPVKTPSVTFVGEFDTEAQPAKRTTERQTVDAV